MTATAADPLQRPTELDLLGGEFQLGSFLVEYGDYWDLDVRCDISVNNREVAVQFTVIHDDHGYWKRGGEGSKATHNGQPLWDPVKPGKVRTAYKQELPTTVVTQAIAVACKQFLSLINPPENWLEDLFYSRRLRCLQGQADSAKLGYEHLVQQAQRRSDIIKLVLQKAPAEKIALFRKYGAVLCQSEMSGLRSPGDKSLRAELYRELALDPDC